MIKTHTVHTLTVGEILRETRLDLGLTIEDIAHRTRIKPIYLQAFETSDYKAFSSGVYARGLLKNYAKYLELDVEQICALYRRELGEEDQQIRKVTTEQVAKNFDRFISQRGLYLAIGIIILMLFGLYLFSQVNAVFQPPRLELSAPLTATGTANSASYDFKTNNDRVVIKGITAGQTLITINGQLTATNASYEFNSSEIPLPAAQNKIKITATNQFGRSAEILLNISRINFAENVTAINVAISIKQNTEIKVKSDGQKQVTLVAKTGEAYSFISQNLFELTTADPDKVTATVNNLQVELHAGNNTWRLDKGALLQN